MITLQPRSESSVRRRAANVALPPRGPPVSTICATLPGPPSEDLLWQRGGRRMILWNAGSTGVSSAQLDPVAVSLLRRRVRTAYAVTASVTPQACRMTFASQEARRRCIDRSAPRRSIAAAWRSKEASAPARSTRARRASQSARECSQSEHPIFSSGEHPIFSSGERDKRFLTPLGSLSGPDLRQSVTRALRSVD